MNARSRAQASMPDVLLATGLFLLIVVGLLVYQQDVQERVQTSISRKTLDVVASNAAEFIIKNPGDPTNWETLSDYNQIVSIGLAQKDRVLNPNKVIAFINLGNLEYSFARERLYLSSFDFYLEMSGGVNLTTGQAPPPTANKSVVQRLVTINGEETTVVLTVYAT